jgi:hypothetical protein
MMVRDRLSRQVVRPWVLLPRRYTAPGLPDVTLAINCSASSRNCALSSVGSNDRSIRAGRRSSSSGKPAASSRATECVHLSMVFLKAAVSLDLTTRP